MPHLRTPSQGILATAALLIAGCSGDKSPTGPSPNFSLDGAWTYSVSNAKNGTTTCSAGPYTVTFTTTGGVVTGTIAATSSTELTCVINGQSQSIAVNGTASLTSATRNGSSISFGYTTTNGPASVTGTIQSDNRMSGQGSITVSISGNVGAYAGTWSATR
jgi:hypothetical protein